VEEDFSQTSAVSATVKQTLTPQAWGINAIGVGSKALFASLDYDGYHYKVLPGMLFCMC
jgi:hypothetical protein